MDKPKKQCFILMPFQDDLKEIYTEVYTPVCAEHDLYCWRVDEISRPGSISRDIIEGILSADIIIADLTRKNPNVFYELGIAHSIGNKTIMTAQGLGHVPFDIRDYRVIIYEHSLKGCRQLREDLSKAMDELLVALDRTNNPFQDVLATRSSIGRSLRDPLAKNTDFSEVAPRIRQWLLEHSIRYYDQLSVEILEEIYATPGIGKKVMSGFCSSLMRSGLFPDVEGFNDFIIKYGLDTSGTRRFW